VIDPVCVERYPEDVVEPPLAEDDPLLEELEVVVDELRVVVVDVLDDVLDDEPEPISPIYGQGLQSPYENPHVCPKRHVQPRPTVGSLGQFWIPVHVWVPDPELDPEPDPEPDDYITYHCQSW
jgi:hypothetical protein